MVLDRVLATISVTVGTFAALAVLVALDVQSPAVAAATYVTIALFLMYAVRWRTRGDALVLRTRGTQRHRVVRPRGPYVVAPLVERVEAVVPLGEQVAESLGEPLVAQDGFVVSAIVRIRHEVVDPRLAVTAMPRERALSAAPAVLRLLDERRLRPDRAVLGAARTWLREQAATVEASTLRGRAAWLNAHLEQHLRAIVPTWGLAIIDVEVEVPAA